jgi:hypothetical protein
VARAAVCDEGFFFLLIGSICLVMIEIPSAVRMKRKINHGSVSVNQVVKRARPHQGSMSEVNSRFGIDRF